jgi:hypothetical protein
VRNFHPNESFLETHNADEIVCRRRPGRDPGRVGLDVGVIPHRRGNPFRGLLCDDFGVLQHGHAVLRRLLLPGVAVLRRLLLLRRLLRLALLLPRLAVLWRLLLL